MLIVCRSITLQTETTILMRIAATSEASSVDHQEDVIFWSINKKSRDFLLVDNCNHKHEKCFAKTQNSERFI